MNIFSKTDKRTKYFGNRHEILTKSRSINGILECNKPCKRNLYMSEPSINSTEKTSVSPLLRTAYVTAAIFTAIILISYTVFFLMGFNVTETRDFVTHTFNGHTDTNSYDFKVGREFAFDLVQLIGFLMFSATLAALAFVHKTSLSKPLKRLIHFIVALVAFYLFIMVLSGSASNGGFGVSMGITVAFALFYFAVVGIAAVLKKLIRIPDCAAKRFALRYLPPILLVFTVTVIVAMALAMVMNVQININKIGPNYPYDDRVAINTYETIITPLAPTFQNYLRYLGSSAALVLSIAALSLKLAKGIKALLVFVINGAALALLWLIQLDFFKELDGALLYAAVGYVVLYLVIVLTVGIISHVRKRNAEDEEEYESQFLGAKRKN